MQRRRIKAALCVIFVWEVSTKHLMAKSYPPGRLIHRKNIHRFVQQSKFINFCLSRPLGLSVKFKYNYGCILDRGTAQFLLPPFVSIRAIATSFALLKSKHCQIKQSCQVSGGRIQIIVWMATATAV